MINLHMIKLSMILWHILLQQITGISLWSTQTLMYFKESLSQSEPISTTGFFQLMMKLLTSQRQHSTVANHLVNNTFIKIQWWLRRERIKTRTLVEKIRDKSNLITIKWSLSSLITLRSNPLTSHLLRRSRINMIKSKRSKDTSVTWLTSIQKTWHTLLSVERKQRDWDYKLTSGTTSLRKQFTSALVSTMTNLLMRSSNSHL